MKRFLALILLLLAVGGCNSLINYSDSVGENSQSYIIFIALSGLISLALLFKK
jgi:hypothetical protein